VDPGLDDAAALEECGRCLQCDCLARYDCKLRAYGEQYEASSNRYSATPPPLARDASAGDVVFEPHKCILCGVCVRLAESRGERLGIGFQQRGYSTRVAVPFDAQLADGLEETYRLCAEACPTGALAIREKLPEEKEA
jgi:predicted molibdopterin-dependent oxidoreductase YjgC